MLISRILKSPDCQIKQVALNFSLVWDWIIWRELNRFNTLKVLDAIKTSQANRSIEQLFENRHSLGSLSSLFIGNLNLGRFILVGFYYIEEIFIVLL